MKKISTLLFTLLVIASANVFALPVRLTTFTAAAETAGVKLQWQTAQEAASREFSIERSTDGVTFTAIGTIAAAGTVNEKQDYTYTDRTCTKGINYYRLKEIGNTGVATYSVIRTVDAAAGTSPLLWKLEGASIQVQLPGAANASYIVSSIGGRLVQKGNMANGKARLQQLSPGMYSIMVQSAAGIYGAKLMVH